MPADALTTSDLRALLASAHELHTAADSSALAEQVQQLLQRLIGAEVVVWNELTRGGRVSTGMTFPDMGEGFWREVSAGMFAHMHEHPFVHHLRQHQLPKFVASISDLMPTGRFVETGLYRNGYDAFRARHQISAAVGQPGGDYLVISLNRHTSDFSGRDKVVLDYVTRQASAVYGSLRRCEQLANRLTLLTLQPHCREATWLYCDSNYIITWGDPQLAPFLREHFGHETSDLFLPLRLQPCFRAQQAAWRETGVPADRQSSGGHMTIGDQEFYLHFERRGSGTYRIIIAPARRGVRLLAPRIPLERLTPRQLEVAHWVAEGKSNTEIGIILGISGRTAEKHVHAALAKFGVETRLQLARVLDQLSTTDRPVSPPFVPDGSSG